jgi:hypothetical protein
MTVKILFEHQTARQLALSRDAVDRSWLLLKRTQPWPEFVKPIPLKGAVRAR